MSKFTAVDWSQAAVPSPLREFTIPSPFDPGGLLASGASHDKWVAAGWGVTAHQSSPAQDLAVSFTSTSTVLVEVDVDTTVLDQGFLHDGRMPLGPVNIGLRLRMYGLPAGAALLDFAGVPVTGVGLGQDANVKLANLPAPYSGQFNIAYVDTEPLTVSSAPDFTVEVGQGLTALRSTGIPSQTAARTLDGVNAMAVYKDVHVLELKNGAGWLMLLARYHSPAGSVLGPGGGNADPRTSLAAIVGYWCGDASFTANVKGPYFLVNRYGEFPDVPLWLGVPAACELEVDGVDYLYVYYTADLDMTGTGDDEQANGVAPPDWAPGTRAKRIDTRFLPWGNSFATAFEKGLLPASTDEERWDSATADEEVDGEYLGKVYIWVATGAPWSAGDDPAALGNTLMWNKFSNLKDVESVPVTVDSRPLLFFSANNNGASTTPTGNKNGWGLWRAACGPRTTGRELGMDFAVHPLGPAGASPDRIIKSEGLERLWLDPDPVRLRGGDWLAFAGADDAAAVIANRPAIPFPLIRFEASQGLAERSFREAW